MNCDSIKSRFIKGEENSMKFKVIISALIVGSMLFFVGCDNENNNNANNQNNNQNNVANVEVDENQDSNTDLPEIVATVNGVDVLQEDYLEAFNQMKLSYEQQGVDFTSEEGIALIAQIEESTMDRLIQKEVLVQATKDAGVSVTEEEAQAEINSIKSQYPTEEDFEKVLEENQLTEATLLELFVEEMSIEAYIKSNIEVEEVTDAEALEQFELYLAQIEGTEDEAQAPEFEEIKDALKDQMRQGREQEKIYEFIDQLIEESDVEIYL